MVVVSRLVLCGLGDLNDFPLLGFIKESMSNREGEGAEDAQTEEGHEWVLNE